MRKFAIIILVLFSSIICFGQTKSLLRGDYPGCKLIPSEGGYFIIFEVNGKYGIAGNDELLTVCIEPIFDGAYNENFHKHHNCIRVEQNGKWGILDASRRLLPRRQLIVPCIYDKIGEISPEGKAEAVLNGKKVVIDTEAIIKKLKEEY